MIRVELTNTRATYDKDPAHPNRAWPIDAYWETEVQPKLAPILAKASEWHFLKLPLLGQWYDAAGNPGKFKKWCGRTTCTMVWNWFEVAKGGDPKERYISFWDGNHEWAMDLRHADGKRAFHTHPINADKPDKPGQPVEGIKTYGLLHGGDDYDYVGLKERQGYLASQLFPWSASETRQAEAARIASNELLVEEQFKPILETLRRNKPVCMWSRLSTTKHRAHIVVVSGYCYLRDATGKLGLWLLIADPSSPHNESKPQDKGLKKAYVRQFDPASIDPDSTGYVFIQGSWGHAQASLYLLRASFLFTPAPTTLSASENSSLSIKDAAGPLMLDHGYDGSNLYLAPDSELLEVPEALLESSLNSRSFNYNFLSYPFLRSEGEFAGPVHHYYNSEAQPGGYYPLGLRRNLHPGIHLRPFPPPPEAEPPPPDPKGRPPATPVHAAASGWVVAARLGPPRPEVVELTGGPPAFVLLRHELREADQDDESDPIVLYSLYMHLDPLLDIAATADDIPWVARLSKQAYGQVVAIDAEELPTGALRWAAEELPPDQEVSGQVACYEGEETQLLTYTPKEGGVAAVLKPAPGDVAQAWQGLQGPGVVTFNQPHLCVHTGEVIGFVAPDPVFDAGYAAGDHPMPSGFLHWELFAPAGEGIQKLVDLAQSELGVTLDLLELEAEEDEADFYGIGELEEKLQPLLPEGAREPLGSEEAENRGLFKRWNYEHALAGLMRNRSDLSFADPEGIKEDGTFPHGLTPLPPKLNVQEASDQEEHLDCGLTYPLALHLDNLSEGDWPEGATRLELSFSPEGQGFHSAAVELEAGFGSVTEKVQAPAAATEVLVSASDGYLEPVLLEEEDALEVQKEALAALVPYRWRQVVLRHKNSWSERAFSESLGRRFNDLDLLAPIYRQTVWWEPGLQDEETPHGEVPVFGEASVFGDVLPKDGEDLDHVHPVTGVWLLNSLLVAKKLRLTEHFEPAQGDEDPNAPIHWGVVSRHPLDQIPLGSTFTVVIVTGGTANWVPFHLVAEKEGSRIPIGHVITKGGVAVVTFTCTLWGGPWEIKIEGHESSASKVQLPTQITSVFPQLGSVGMPIQQANGRWDWDVPFNQRCPDRMEGWITLWKTRVAVPEPDDDGDASADDDHPRPIESESEVLIPIVATKKPPAAVKKSSKLILDTRGFITGPENSLGCPVPGSSDSKFKTEDFRFDGKLFVNLELVKFLNEVRLGAISTRVAGVDAAGCELTIEPWSSATDQTKQQKLLDSAQAVKDKWDKDGKKVSFKDLGKSAAGKYQVQLSIEPPPEVEEGGVMNVDFDPSEALNELLQELGTIKPDEFIPVRFGMVLPSGGWQGDNYYTDPEDLNSGCVCHADPREGCDGKFLAAVAPTACVVLSGVKFLHSRTEEGTKKLTVSIDLHGGTADEWRAAKPLFHWLGKTGGSVVTAADGEGKSVAARLEVSVKLEDLPTSEVEFEAKLTADSPRFNGNEVTVAAVTIPYDAKPRLDALEVDWDSHPHAVVIRAMSHGLPSDKGFKLRVTGADDLGPKAVFSAANYATRNGKKTAIAGSGCRDSQGYLQAELPKEEVWKAFAQPDATWSLEFYRPSGWSNGKVRGLAVQASAQNLAIPPKPDPDETQGVANAGVSE